MTVAAVAAGTVLVGAGGASASAGVDFSGLEAAEQVAITEAVSRFGGGADVGGKWLTVGSTSGNGPCFGIYVGRVTMDSNGRITKIETATVEFYQPVLSCLI